MITGWGFLLSIPVRKDLPAYKLLWLELMSLFIIILVRSFTAPSFQVMHPALVMFMVLIVCVAALRRLRFRVDRRTSQAPTDADKDAETRHRRPGPDRPGDSPAPIRQPGG